jgi:hypothetical protein
MAVGFRGASSAFRDGGGTLPINKPGGTVENDRLIAFLNEFGATAPTIPSGWGAPVLTIPILTGAGTTNSTVYLYAKTAGGSEPASWTWTTDDGASGGVIALSDAGSIVDSDSSTTGTGMALTLNAPSVDAVAAGSMALFGMATGRGTTFAMPGGVTEAFDQSSGTDPNETAIAVGYKAVNAGATGTQLMTNQDPNGHGVDQSVAFSLVVGPAVVAAPPVGSLALLGVGR